MLTKAILKNLDTLHGNVSTVTIFSDGSGWIDDVDENRVFSFNTLEVLEAHLTQRAPDARKSAPKSRSKNSKGSAKPARG